MTTFDKIEGKIDQLQDIIGDICELITIATEQPNEDDEEGHNKLNKVLEHLDAAYDQAYDLRTAYEDFTDYMEADHEPYYFNNSYNGVSEKDFA